MERVRVRKSLTKDWTVRCEARLKHSQGYANNQAIEDRQKRVPREVIESREREGKQGKRTTVSCKDEEETLTLKKGKHAEIKD